MRESRIEAHLRKKVRNLGGQAYKFTSPGRRGVPDRLVLLPGGVVRFVELKSCGLGLGPLQALEVKRLNELGFVVAVLDSIEAVDLWCKTLG
jgi:hypothetical protein